MSASRGLSSSAVGLAAIRRARARTCRDLERIIEEGFSSGSLRPKDALHLFEELLPQARPSSVLALNRLLSVLSRAGAESFSSVRDGPVLVLSLFNRMARAGFSKVAPTVHTYGMALACCSRLGRLDLSFAVYGKILKSGCRANVTTLNHLVKALCDAKRTSEAMDMVLGRMRELGCMPDVVSYNIILKGLCKEKRSQEAMELLHMMLDLGDSCRPNLVSYNTVIHGFLREHNVGKAYSLFQEMSEKGVLPDRFTYNSLIHGFCSVGQWKKATRLLEEMSRAGLRPDVVTYCAVMDYHCKNGGCTEARKFFDSMVHRGPKPTARSEP